MKAQTYAPMLLVALLACREIVEPVPTQTDEKILVSLRPLVNGEIVPVGTRLLVDNEGSGEQPYLLESVDVSFRDGYAAPIELPVGATVYVWVRNLNDRPALLVSGPLKITESKFEVHFTASETVFEVLGGPQCLSEAPSRDMRIRITKSRPLGGIEYSVYASFDSADTLSIWTTPGDTIHARADLTCGAFWSATVPLAPVAADGGRHTLLIQPQQGSLELELAGDRLPDMPLRVAWSVGELSVRTTVEASGGLITLWAPGTVASLEIFSFDANASFVDYRRTIDWPLVSTPKLNLGARRLQIQVRDPQDRPAAQADIRIERSLVNVFESRTADALGNFTLYVPDGSYRLGAYSADDRFYAPAEVYDVFGDRVITIVLDRWN